MCKHHYQGSTQGNAACCMDTADCPQMTLMKSDKTGKKERRGLLASYMKLFKLKSYSK